MAATADELLDAVQIGHELGVNPVTVRKWMTLGLLRTRKVGRRRVARRAWVDDFIDDQTPPADDDGDED